MIESVCNPQSDTRIPRRNFLRSSGAALSLIAGQSVLANGLCCPVEAAEEQKEKTPKENYDSQAKGIRILPGQWRPHYPWEQIAWVSPSWPSQDYLWLDFPEAIFTDQELLFLSHINPPFPTVFQDLPKVPWQEVPKGIAFERELPNGVRFGGSVTKADEQTVDLELHIVNGSKEPLTAITLQTCAFLRAIKEFADFTKDNKFVHTRDAGWIAISAAEKLEAGNAPYRVGWRRSGKPIADLPVVLTRSNKAERYLAMTWFDSTLSIVSNPVHPCVHADPQFPDIAPGNSKSIRGRLLFYEGPLDEFEFTQMQ